MVSSRADERGFLNRSLGRDLDAQHCSVSVYELQPGSVRRRLPLRADTRGVADRRLGRADVRTPAGERTLRAGDTVAFVPGVESAHQMRNDSEAPARFAMPSTREQSRSVVYPELGQVAVAGPGFFRMLELGGAPVDMTAVHPLSEANLLEVAVEDDADDPDGYRTRYARSRAARRREAARPARFTDPARTEHLPVPLRDRVRRVADRAHGTADAAHAGGRAGATRVGRGVLPGRRGRRAQGDEQHRRGLCASRSLEQESTPAPRSIPTRTRSASAAPNKLFRLGDAVDYWDGEIGNGPSKS